MFTSAVSIPGTSFLTSRGSILSVPEIRDALNELSITVNNGTRPPALEGTYSFQFRYARHTLDTSMVGMGGTMEVEFSNQRPSEIDYRLGAPGAHSVVNGFVNGGGTSFPGQPPLDDDFTVVGVIVNSASFLGLPCRERDAIVISGRVNDAGDLKIKMLVMTYRIEADCVGAIAKAGHDPESIPGEHVILIGEAFRLGP
ncbi:MAG: hypothetical protein ACYTGZ_10020 [Planctomycetota bacterium]